MKQDEFEREFARIISRLGAFHQRAAGPPEGVDLFPEAIEELGSALEELRVSEEQLRSQADQAASTQRLSQQAFERLRATARSSQRRLADVAAEVVKDAG